MHSELAMNQCADESKSHAEWRSAIEAELGVDCFERRLTTTTYEGLRVAPLYTPSDVASDTVTVMQRTLSSLVQARAEPASRRLVHDLRDAPCAAQDSLLARDFDWGSEALWLTLAARGPEASRVERGSSQSPDGLSELAARLRHVPLARALLVLDSGAELSAALPLVLAVLERREVSLDVAEVAFNADPVAALAASGRSPAMEGQLAGLAELAVFCQEHAPRSRAVLVSSEPYSNAGANAVQEIGATLATAIDYLRVLQSAGLSAARASGQMVLRMPVGCDLFLEIAKLRALRFVWQRVLAECGVDPVRALTPIHACSAERALSRRGRAVNALRSSVGCFAAFAGGADWISVAPQKAAFAGPEELGFNLARQIALILRHEAQLESVSDPAAGSYYVDALSEQLALEGWRQMQEICARGGMCAVLRDGSFAEQIARVRAEREKNVRTRKDVLVSLSEFTDLDEPAPASEPAPLAVSALPAMRLSESFEAVRDRSDAFVRTRGRRPLAGLVDLTRGGRERARAAFARGALESGGFAVVDVQPAPGAPQEESFRASGARVALLCLSENSAPEALQAAIGVVRRGGARHVVSVARRPAPGEAAPEGVDAWLFQGCDLPLLLMQILAWEEG
jgi:methylmalonyl-CoA mutase